MVFKFEMGHQVDQIGSSLRGIVIASTEYVRREPRYLVQYEKKSGRVKEKWFHESALEYPRFKVG